MFECAAIVAAVSPELQTVGIVLGALVAVLGLIKLITDRQTEVLKAHTTVTMLEHTAECPARAAQAAATATPQIVDARGEPSQRWPR